MGAQSCNFYNFGGHFLQFLSDLLAQARGFDADKRPCWLGSHAGIVVVYPPGKKSSQNLSTGDGLKSNALACCAAFTLSQRTCSSCRRRPPPFTALPWNMRMSQGLDCAAFALVLLDHAGLRVALKSGQTLWGVSFRVSKELCKKKVESWASNWWGASWHFLKIRISIRKVCRKAPVEMSVRPCWRWKEAEKFVFLGQMHEMWSCFQVAISSDWPWVTKTVVPLRNVSISRTQEAVMT